MQGWKKMVLMAASCVLIVAMVVVWVWADLGTADGIASVVGASAGVVGMAYALTSGNGAQPGPVLTAVRTGKATTKGGGMANTGISMPAAGPQAQVSTDSTGDAESHGSGDANTGVHLT
ncbi:hypothetical protein [Streptomyces sp. NPDC127084]|uniref:hypothetical protein n=1 Tax=Streptomyces sp. NPDC127084 TaxID=3347133 RepID=UPI00365BD3F5